MSATILNSGEATELVRTGTVVLDPFIPKRYRGFHYALGASSFQRFFSNRSAVSGDRQDLSLSPIVSFAPHEYVLFEISEQIVLPNELWGELTTTRIAVVNGFMLNAGKIDPLYGRLRHERQPVVVGLQNLLGTPNNFDSRWPIAQLGLYRDSGVSVPPVVYTKEEIDSYKAIAADDGVSHANYIGESCEQH